MPYENNIPDTNPPPPPPPPPAQQDAQLRSELESARKRNKILKIAAITLSVLFLITAGAVFYIYTKIQRTKAALAEAFQNAPLVFPGYVPEGGALPSMNRSVFSSTNMPVSSLGLFSGSMPGSTGPLDPAEGEKIYDALAKYADRPVVKEFIADLKKNPDMARAFEQSKGNNPLKVIASIQGAKGVDKIVAKYATRPEFMKLMLDVMKDPDLKRLMAGLPGGMPLPGAGAPPAAQTGPLPPGAEEPLEEESDAPLVLDSSAISGAPAPGTAPARSKKVPPPVDSE